jgi:DNA topoisomerase-3
MSMVVVVAEKPSVGRDLARVLGATRKGEGFLEGNGYRVTWAIGHLVGLAEPHEVNPEWKRWDFSLLPMVPGRWPLSVLRNTRAQFAILRGLLRAADVDRVVCATDAGREGELIFRLIYEAAGCKKPVQRLWISSLTDSAIRDGFARLKDARSFDALADAARARSQADWLVGMNLSRAYGLSLGQTGISVGRVQTPTLALVVQREREVRDFRPEDYLEVVATFEGPTGARYRGTWFRPRPGGMPPSTEWQGRRLPPDGAEAGEVVARARAGRAAIETVRAETKRMPPPALYDLTELQRHANRLYGLSAQRTLSAAQALYERHKLLSYPRTDSRHLSRDVAQTLPGVVAAIADGYRDALAPGTGARPLGPRFVDDAQVSDHHAIIPTDRRPQLGTLGADERRIYDLVCRRLLSAWHGDHVWDLTTVVTAITPPAAASPVDRFHSQGTAVRQEGWKVLDVKEDDAQALPAGLLPGQPQRVVDARAVKKATRPPPRYTEATLLTAMETAGAALEDKELCAAMKDRGLGTPATRAATIETLLTRGYIVRSGKTLSATDKGIGLIAAVDPTVASPAMTGDWEARLKRIERSEEQLAAFMDAIERYVRDVVGRVPRPGGGRTGPPPARRGSGRARAPGKGTATKRGTRKRRPSAATPAVADPALEGRILEALRARDGQSTGRMCKALLGEDMAHRRGFEAVLGKLAADGKVRLAPDVFEVDGRKVPFKRAWLSAAAGSGRSAR